MENPDKELDIDGDESSRRTDAYIQLHIERLILDGIDLKPGQSKTLKAAVESELSRLLSKGGVASGLRSGGAFPSAAADSISISEKKNPAALGRQIAQSVYGGIGQAKSYQKKKLS